MKSRKLFDFKQRFESDIRRSGKLPIFEISVFNKVEKEEDYIIFYIDVVNSFFVAKHDALTEREQKSKKIAFKRIKIDPDFSIDENLQELYSECIQAIIDSDFFELPEDN